MPHFIFRFLRDAMALAIFGLSLFATRADQVVLIPIADATLIEAAPNNSDGGATWITAGTTQNYTRNRALMLFDITNGIPPGAQITLVSLNVAVTRKPAEPPPSSYFSVRRMLRPWGEGSTLPGDSPGLGNDAQLGDATWLQPFFGTTNYWASPGGAEGLDFSTTVSASTLIGYEGDYQFEPTFQLIADVVDQLKFPG